MNRSEREAAERTVWWCAPCNKATHFSRRAARATARRLGRRGLDQYRCPHQEQGWHNGHLPTEVKRGHKGRDQM